MGRFDGDRSMKRIGVYRAWFPLKKLPNLIDVSGRFLFPAWYNNRRGIVGKGWDKPGKKFIIRYYTSKGSAGIMSKMSYF